MYIQQKLFSLGSKGFYILRIYIMFWGSAQKERYLSVKISSKNYGIILHFKNEIKYKVREFNT